MGDGALMAAGGIDATSAAIWAAIAVVLARTVLELLRDRRNGAPSSAKRLDEVVRMLAPDWRGIPAVQRLLEERVIPLLEEIRERLR